VLACRGRDAVLATFKVFRIDEGRRQVWRRIATWDVVERLGGGCVRVRDIETGRKYEIDLTGNEASANARGKPILRELRQRYRAAYGGLDELREALWGPL
jgi:hypothetical protein